MTKTITTHIDRMAHAKHLQYDQSDGVGSGATRILLQNGSGVGVQQRAQLQDDDGLAHAVEGVGGVNMNAIYMLREQSCTSRNFQASRITRHTTHVTPVSIKRER
jgi:hypothetical protein